METGQGDLISLCPFWDTPLDWAMFGGFHILHTAMEEVGILNAIFHRCQLWPMNLF